MKYCPYCGADIPDGAVSFCAECGKALPAKDSVAVIAVTDTLWPSGVIPSVNGVICFGSDANLLNSIVLPLLSGIGLF